MLLGENANEEQWCIAIDDPKPFKQKPKNNNKDNLVAFYKGNKHDT